MGRKENSALIDELVIGSHIITLKVERVLRLVDRGIFVHPHGASVAYRDSPFRSNSLHPGQIHISAPSIYCSVLEKLDFHKNQSFLNIGSGSGYFSAVVGFLLGEHGISHGIELHSNVIEHARESLHLFASQKFIVGFDWCRPQFVHGNAFMLNGISRRYDRIYVGAQIEHKDLALFSEMLKENGIMIVPVRNEGDTRFQQVKRTSEGFETNDFMHVAFAELVPPTVDRAESSSTSRKRKLIDKPTNPNDRVTEDLISCFKPNSLTIIASYAVRQMVADPLRMTLPIAFVQKIINTNDEPMASENRSHTRIAQQDILANGPIIRGNDAFNSPLHQQIVNFGDTSVRNSLPNNPRNVPGDALFRNIEQRISEDSFGLHSQALEEGMEPEFNNGAGGPHDDEDEMAMSEPLMNVMRREAEARMTREQEHNENIFNFDDRNDREEVVVDVTQQQAERIRRDFFHERDDVLFHFHPFRLRIREEASDDDSNGDERSQAGGRLCQNCGRVMCNCNDVPTLKYVATRVVDAHRNQHICRMAKAQEWVKRITLLSRCQRRPRSFADQIPTIFEEIISVPCVHDRLMIEDWYLQRNRNRFIAKLDKLERIVRNVGRLQFKQEMSDYKKATHNADFKKVSYNDEQESIFRFERKIVDVLDNLPISQNIKEALKWNLYRES